jgi:ADP-heptose:LPS heptosyltransferase
MSPAPISAASEPGAWSTVRRLLVMRADNIGDVIMAGPALRALKENLPDLHLTLLASPAGSQAAGLLPWIDDLLTWRVLWQDLGRLPFDPEREWSLVERLRDGRFDAALILTSFSQTPYPAAFLCQLAGIPLRAGESKEVGNGELTLFLPSAPDALQQAERNLRLVEVLGFAVGDRDLALRIPVEATEGAARLLAGAGRPLPAFDPLDELPGAHLFSRPLCAGRAAAGRPAGLAGRGRRPRGGRRAGGRSARTAGRPRHRPGGRHYGC